MKTTELALVERLLRRSQVSHSRVLDDPALRPVSHGEYDLSGAERNHPLGWSGPLQLLDQVGRAIRQYQQKHPDQPLWYGRCTGGVVLYAVPPAKARRLARPS